MKSLGIIGFGNMGEALMSAVKDSNPGLKLYTIEKIPERKQLAIETYKAIDCSDKPEQLFSESEAVILAVKPQELEKAAKDYRQYAADSSLISIAAGVNIETLHKLFGSSQITRFMPSLAASVGQSVTSVSYSEKCSASFKTLAFSVAESIGLAIEMPENLIPGIIGISGSGIAYVYEFINALALGGVKNGIKFDSSLDIAMKVLEGAVATIRNSGVAPSELITRVCSPGGTTIEGISSLHKNNFSSTVIEAVTAAADKARELEN